MCTDLHSAAFVFTIWLRLLPVAGLLSGLLAMGMIFIASARGGLRERSERAAAGAVSGKVGRGREEFLAARDGVSVSGVSGGEWCLTLPTH